MWTVVHVKISVSLDLIQDRWICLLLVSLVLKTTSSSVELSVAPLSPAMGSVLPAPSPVSPALVAVVLTGVTVVLTVLSCSDYHGSTVLSW